MINEIKTVAGKVSEDYLLHQKDMNDSIVGIATKKKYNEEIVRRICEFANQNTYLNLFHADKAKRGNITFDVADSKKILDRIKELNMNENDYLKSPDDYKVTDEYGQEEEEGTADKIENDIRQDISNIKAKIRLNDRLGHLLSAIKSMAVEEEANAEDNVLKISSYCRGLTFNGESYMDMVKLAMRYTQDRGYDMEKTAALYSKIGEYLTEKGFKVNTELTKTSSLKINKESSVYNPLESYHTSLIKLSGLREMKASLEAACNKLSKEVASGSKATGK